MKTNKLLLAAALSVASLAMATTASACSLSAWSATAGTVVANQPDQSPSVARYAGLCAAQADAIGDFVTDNTPAGEASFRAQFYLFTGTHSGGSARVFEARNAGGTAMITVNYDGTNLIFGMNGTGTTRTAAVTANRWYQVQLAWEASATGSLTIGLQGAGSDTPIAVAAITGVNNSSDRIDDARLGKISGSGTGFINVDAYDSRRTTTPARLLRGDANGNGSINVGDAIAARNEALGGTLSPGIPDCNENGGVNVGDAVCIRNIALGG